MTANPFAFVDVKTNRWPVLAALVLMALTSAGCGSADISIGSTILPPAAKLNSTAEFVSGSRQGYRTANGFVVDSSVGSTYANLYSLSTTGYRVYSTTQGTLISQAIELADPYQQ